MKLAPGQTAQATATVLDAGGDELHDRVAVWASSDVSVVSVTPTGLVTAIAPGAASIRATVEGIVGSSPIAVVLPPQSSLTTSGPMVGDGVTAVSLAATFLDRIGAPIQPASVSWTTDRPDVCRFAVDRTTTDGTGTTHNTLTCAGGGVQVSANVGSTSGVSAFLTFSSAVYWVRAAAIAQSDRITQVTADPTGRGGAWAFGLQGDGQPVLYHSDASGTAWARVASGAALPTGMSGFTIASSGDLYSLGPYVARSTDAGVTWSQPTPSLPRGAAQIVTIDGALLYATDPSAAVFASGDGGGAWALAGTVPLPSNCQGKAPLLALSADGGTLYAWGSGSPPCLSGAAVTSSDRGVTWVTRSLPWNAQGLSGQPQGIRAILTSPTDSATAFAFADYHMYTLLCPYAAMYVTHDRGGTWTGVSAPKGTTFASDQHGKVLYVAETLRCQEGIGTSLPARIVGSASAGQSWGSWSWNAEGLFASSLAADARTPGVLYAVLSDGYLYRTADGIQ